MKTPPSSVPISELQNRFLKILPRIEKHARVVFRWIKCQDRKEDFICEMIALIWKWILRLTARGKDPMEFIATLADYAGRQVRAGRRLCGQDRSKDVLSPRAQRTRGFVVASLPDGSRLLGNVFDDALRDNTRSEVPALVAFKMDFPAWLCSRTERDRQLIDDLMLGERTRDMADKHGLSAGRISQLRREYLQAWRTFCGEEEGRPAPAKA